MAKYLGCMLALVLLAACASSRSPSASKPGPVADGSTEPMKDSSSPDDPRTALLDQFEAHGIATTGFEHPTKQFVSTPGKGGDGATTFECSREGDRRIAVPEEMAAYCVCTTVLNQDGSPVLVWDCYGPSMEQRSRESLECQAHTTLGGDGESCLEQWTCDGTTYSFSCIEGSCVCIVDGETAQVPIEIDRCVDLDEINFQCGWMLNDARTTNP